MSRKIATDKFVAEMCRQSYYSFFLEFWPLIAAEKLVDNWHIRKLCDELQFISERVFLDKPKQYDLLTNCPPGTSKSSIFSILWQPWIWTRFPSARFISASYSELLALDLSRKSRDVILSDKYKALFPGISMRADQDTKGYFVNNFGGMRRAVGVGSAVTGLHAHFIAIDDPINPLEALSDLVLNTSNIWINETLADRKVDKQVVPTVIVMQRLHQNDPSGNWLDSKRRTKHICLPAESSWDVKPAEWIEFYQTSITDDYPNKLLDPKRLPPSVLKEAEDKGEAFYAGQYGQQPVPRCGAMFKIDRLTFAKSPPARFKRGPYRYWDKAGCLIANTLICTDQGLCPIQNIRAGDLALTRQGMKGVNWAGISAYVSDITSVLFANGTVLTGTPNHPVWTEDRNWVDLAMLEDYDRVKVSTLMGDLWAGHETSLLSPLPLKESATHGNQERGTLRYGDGIQNLVVMEQILCTEPFGVATMETFPLAIISITRTKIGTIIRLRISNALLAASTCCGIETNLQLQSIEHFCRRFAQRHLSGLLPFGKQLDTDGISAFIAGRSFAVGALTKIFLNTVLLPVGHEPEQTAVYDLHVDDCHEFYANGVLVHNTKDAGAYTAGVKMALDYEDRVWILDCVRGQWDSGVREKIILDTARSDGKYCRVGVEQEPGAAGKESAEATATRLAFNGFRCLCDKPTGDKETRADPLSVIVNSGKCVILEGPWNRDYLEEMKYFPVSRFKDQIDASSGCFALIGKKRLRIGAL